METQTQNEGTTFRKYIKCGKNFVTIELTGDELVFLRDEYRNYLLTEYLKNIEIAKKSFKRPADAVKVALSMTETGTDKFYTWAQNKLEQKATEARLKAENYLEVA